MADETLEEALERITKEPLRTRVDNTEIENHRLPDMLAAMKYLASINAVKTGGIVWKKIKGGTPV